MTTIFAREALLPGGWASDVRVTLADGRISAIEPGARVSQPDLTVQALIPGMPNLHSHAFQRGMAGRAETRGTSHDTFWTWREVMYHFACTMTPEQVEAVAAQAYIEMLERGFTRVGEFHYLHHDRDGQPYADLGEMAARIAAAADQTGIALTLLPSFYAHSDFGGADPVPGQRRFICDVPTFACLVQRSGEAIAGLPDAVLGVAPHSLRAVTPDELAAVTALLPGQPIHIHAAEQQREVDASLRWSGQRPVEWLLDHAALDPHWCLIHATHLTPDETTRLAASGAVAGLCPVTEGNLGDGIFPGADFRAAGGSFGIGTDSNVLVGVPDELRQLEYAQRLRDQARNVMASDHGSTGRALLDAALAGGAQALGAPAAAIAIGAPADLVALDGQDAPGADADWLLDAWLFAGTVRVDRAWRAGREVVRDGRHIDRDRVAARFADAVRAILGAA